MHIEVPSYAKTDIILRRQAYTAITTNKIKIPKWVSWHLTREHTFGPQRRLSNFIVDEQVPAPRAEIVDYKDSGYDRGHMCPAGDNKWGLNLCEESFVNKHLPSEFKSELWRLERIRNLMQRLGEQIWRYLYCLRTNFIQKRT